MRLDILRLDILRLDILRLDIYFYKNKKIMAEKYQNKYRIASTRASWWDYGSNAAYFVTICTQNRIHFFGKIENQTMVLSEIGRSAETCWFEIPNHFPFVQLGSFVVMPNHIHGIIIIDKPNPKPVKTGISVIPVIPVIPVMPVIPIVVVYFGIRL